ncbi:phage tail protein [Hazenella sp. IB182357]|uniref:Phage tail protein n=1 Tax=Polycladospora coralii TaxID=2771432 RepID=A0A926N6Z4_9BACL|nr:major tail protein [Polycladospora coralii]MBD1373714.1 phage tail protein [Polycladospora coralii]
MPSTNSAQVGLKDLYYALLTKDDSTGVTYDTPQKLAPAVSATVTPNVESATDYADDGAFETTNSLAAVDVSIETNQLPLDKQAALAGHTVENGMLIKKSTDISPYVALGFRSLKADGSELYVWLYKGKFNPIETSLQTKGESVEFQHPTISGTFVKREHDDAWSISGDTSDTEFKLKNDWFTKVIEKDTTPTA